MKMWVKACLIGDNIAEILEQIDCIRDRIVAGLTDSKVILNNGDSSTGFCYRLREDPHDGFGVPIEKQLSNMD